MKTIALILGLAGIALGSPAAAQDWGNPEGQGQPQAEELLLPNPDPQGTNAPNIGEDFKPKITRKLGRSKPAGKPAEHSTPKPSEDLSGPLNVAPRTETLAPGIYQSWPYSCIIISPGPVRDDKAIRMPGNSWPRQRIIRPDGEFIPRTPGWRTNVWNWRKEEQLPKPPEKK